MSINESYAVFGLGRYGLAVARELVNNGAEVLAVDSDERLVNTASADIPLCKCADVTDPEVIKQLGIANMDVVIISMANYLEASVMAVMHCKSVGVKTVIAKCSGEMQKEILRKVGADKVVFPEDESGTRLAKNLLSSGFVDVVELSSDVSLIEIDVKPEWMNKTLAELDLRKKYGVNVIAMRENEDMHINIDPMKKLNSNAKLVVIGHAAKIGKLK